MNILRQFPLVAWMLLVSVSSAVAAPGDLDAGFGTGGKVVLSSSTSTVTYRGVREFPDGKLIVFGGEDTIRAKRLNADGSTDISWGWGGSLARYGIPASPYVPGHALDLDVLADGSVIVVGKVKQSSTDDYKAAMWRFTANGTLDTNFGTDGRLMLSSTEGAAAEVEEYGGKFYVLYTRSEGTYLTRRHSTGSPDLSFGSIGLKRISTDSFFSRFTDLKITSSGKILVILNTLKRYETDGSLDTTFGSSGSAPKPNYRACDDSLGTVTYAFTKVNVGLFGKLVVTGVSSIHDGYGGTINITTTSAYSANGLLDTVFNSGDVVCGSAWYEPHWSEAIAQSDGKMLVAYGHSQVNLVRLNSDGTKDTSYVTDPVMDWDVKPVDLLLQRLDEKAVVLYEREIHRRLR
jgi:uncharacterized delta-60 repeat protein